MVVLYLYWKNSLIIEKKISFILVGILVNYFVFVVACVVLTLAGWFSLSLVEYPFTIRGLIGLSWGIFVFLFMLAGHILITQGLVKNWVK